jgi:hypothetical protein
MPEAHSVPAVHGSPMEASGGAPVPLAPLGPRVPLAPVVPLDPLAPVVPLDPLAPVVPVAEPLVPVAVHWAVQLPTWQM